MQLIVQRPRTNDGKGLGYENILCEAELQPVPELGVCWHRLVNLKPLEPLIQPGAFPILHRGYFDSHLHLRWLGEMQTSLDFSQAHALGDFKKTFDQRPLASDANYVSGFGWDEEKLSTSIEKLEKYFLDSFDQDLPILLMRVCGHSALVSRALRKQFSIAGKRAWVSDRDLFELYKKLPQPNAEQIKKQILAGQKTLLQMGITGVGDMSLDSPAVAAFQTLAENGQLQIDIVGVVDAGRVPLLEEKGPLSNQSSAISPYLARPARIEMAYWKKYLDGSFGSRTAWLTKPYQDADTFGESLCDTNEIIAAAKPVLEKGFRLSFHAIGDAALDQALQVGQAMARFSDPLKPHRIEHAQLIRGDQLAELAKQKIWTLHVQPGHRSSDLHFIKNRLGLERFNTDAYRLASIAQAGINMGLGSDAPIDSPNPERVLEIVCNELAPQECMDWSTAVWMLTQGSRLIDGLPVAPPVPGALVCLSTKKSLQ